MRSPEVQKDPRRYLQAVQKVIACMTLGIDVSKLFSEMIMVSYTSSTLYVCLLYVPSCTIDYEEVGQSFTGVGLASMGTACTVSRAVTDWLGQFKE